MKILHIGAHIGNFGDSLSAAGVKKVLDESFKKYHIDFYDIRNFYLNGSRPSQLDEALNEYHRDYDHILIGGGGFLTPRPEYNHFSSNSLLEINERTLSKVSKKLIFVSLGYEGDIAYCSKDILNKQSTYLNMLNDRGVRIWLREDAGTAFLPNLHKDINIGLDTACFIERVHHSRSMNNLCIGICPSGGIGPESKTYNSDRDDIVNSLKKTMDFCMKRSIKVNIFCHTNFDYVIAGEIIHSYPSLENRRLINMNCLSNPHTDLYSALSQYAMCNFVISSRYHGCIAGITQGANIFSFKSNKKASIFANKFGEAFDSKIFFNEISSRVKNFSIEKQEKFNDRAKNDFLNIVNLFHRSSD